MTQITAPYPTVDAQIPRPRQHRARAATAKASSSHLTLQRYPLLRSIWECPAGLINARDLVVLNLLLWAVVAAWWFTTTPMPHLPA